MTREALASAYLDIPAANESIVKWLGDWSSADSALFDAIPVKVVLLYTSRSGSEFLCDLLRPHGVSIEEHLNRRSPVGSEAYSPQETDHQYLRRALTEAAGGSFGLKATHEKLAVLVASGELPEKTSRWKFVRLNRRNSVAQAVSLVIAEKTGGWRSDVATGIRLRDSDYDFSTIFNAVQRITTANSLNDRLVAKLGVEPLDITFEGLEADTAGTVEQVIGFIELTSNRSLPPSPQLFPKRQGGDLNRKWEARYRDDVAAGRLPDQFDTSHLHDSGVVIASDVKGYQLVNAALVRENSALWARLGQFEKRVGQLSLTLNNAQPGMTPSMPRGPLPAWYYSRIRPLVPPTIRRLGGRMLRALGAK